jgi:hypothetical protein
MTKERSGSGKRVGSIGSPGSAVCVRVGVCERRPGAACERVCESVGKMLLANCTRKRPSHKARGQRTRIQAHLSDTDRQGQSGDRQSVRRAAARRLLLSAPSTAIVCVGAST